MKFFHIKRLQVICFCVGLIHTAALFFFSLFLSSFVNAVGGGETVDTLLVWSLLATLLLIIIGFIAKPLCYRRLGVETETQANVFMTKQMLSRQNLFFTEVPNGEIQRYIESVAVDAAHFYSMVVINSLQHVICVVSFFGLLFYYSWQLALIEALFIFLLFLFTNGLTKAMAKTAPNYHKSCAGASSKLLELIDKHRLINMLGKEEYFGQKYAVDYREKVFSAFWKYKVLDALYTSVFVFLMIISPLILLVFGLALHDYIFISVGATISCYVLSGQLEEPIFQLGQIRSNLKIHRKNLELLKPLLEEKGEQEGMPLQSFEKVEVFCQGLMFDGSPVLSGFHHLFEKGKIYAIHGETGAGKTTLFKVLLGEIRNSGVRVFYNQINISEIDLKQTVLLCSQNAEFFHASLKENIECGSAFLDEERERIYDICQLTSFVKEYGENKAIDFANSNFSGGEVQRMTLARILIRKPKLLLLDEATSSLDEKTSQTLAERIVAFCRENQITLIASSHTDEFDRYADETIEIRKERR